MRKKKEQQMRNQCIIFITPNWRTWFETTLVKWSSLCWTFNLDRQSTSSWDKSSNAKGEKASPWEWKPAPLSSKISSLFLWCCWPFWRRAESFLAGQRSLRPYLPPRGKREKLHCTSPILCKKLSAGKCSSPSSWCRKRQARKMPECVYGKPSFV